MKPLALLLIAAAASGLAGAAYIHFGGFNIAADEPHSTPVHWLAGIVRDRSIAVHAKGIIAPDLNNPDLLASGGADYHEMCSGCHLQPGVKASEISDGLYPKPPNLALAQAFDSKPEEMFWAIKHGIKMSGMPAWGQTHDDARMWAMVAFIQQLPRLTPVQYQILTTRAEGDDGDMPGMEHGHHHD